MKKSIILIITSIILLGWITNVYAGDILGYPVVEKQARFYSIILGLIGASMALVAGSYLLFWLIDLRKKVAQPALRHKKEIFAGELAAAAQPAK